MVLEPSDYEIPSPGESMDPTSPVDFVSRLAGLVVVLSAVVFAYRLAKNRGASLMDRVAGSLTGGLVSSSGDSGPWDGV